MGGRRRETRDRRRGKWENENEIREMGEGKRKMGDVRYGVRGRRKEIEEGRWETGRQESNEWIQEKGHWRRKAGKGRREMGDKR